MAPDLPTASKASGRPMALTVTRVDARAILGGVAERTFARLEADGILVPANRGRGGRASLYDLRQLVPAYLTYVQGLRPSDERESRARRDRSQAELNEMRLAQQRGELVSRVQILLEGREVVQAARAQLLALPTQLVQRGALTRENQPLVAAMIRATLEELSRWPPSEVAAAS